MKTKRMIVKMTCILCSAITIALLAGCETEHEEHGEAHEHSEKGEKSEKPLAKAKISREEAVKIALAKVPGGEIKEGELENEKGKLIWSFDIATPGTKNIMEVNIDAITGKILATQVETPADEKKEKKDEKD